MAEEILGISAHADFSQMYSELTTLIDKFKESAAVVERMKEELHKLGQSGASSDVIIKKTQELASAQKQASNDAIAALDANRKYWNALNAAGKDITDVQKAHIELSQAYEKLKKEAEDLKKVVGDYSKKAKEAEESTKDMGKAVEDESEKMGRSLENLKNKIIGLITVWSAKEFANKVMETRGAFQQLEVAFTTMLGSAEQANELMQQLTKTAAITPFDLQGVTQGAKQLLAYGIAADEVNDTLIHLGDIAAGLSLPLNDLVYLYGTTMTQGRMFTQDLRQFMGRGIPIAEELAKQFGVTKDKVGELVTAGKVGADEFKKAIMAMSSEGGKFAGLMEAQSKTITGQISNIEDAIDGMLNKIGKQNEGIINGALSTVSSLVENYERVGKVLMGLVATYGAYKAAVITVTAIEATAKKVKEAQIATDVAATVAKGANTAATTTLSAAEMLHYGKIMLVQKAQALLNATMLANPYVWVTTAIVGMVAAFASLKTQQELVNEASDEYERKKDEIIAKEEEHKRKIEELISIAENEQLSTDARKDAMIKLKNEYPDLFKDYKTEIEALKDIAYWKAKIAEIESGKSIQSLTNELEGINRQIKELEGKGIAKYETTTTMYGTSYTKQTGGRTAKEEALLIALRKKRDQIFYKDLKKKQDDDYLKNLTGVSNEELEKQINQRRNLIAKIEVKEKEYKEGEKRQAKGQTTFGGLIGLYSKEELQSQLTSFEWELNRRTEIAKNKNKDFKEEQNKALKEAKDRLAEWKKLSDPKERAKSTEKLNDKPVSEILQEDWEKELENREKAVQEAQKKIGKKGSGKGDSKAEQQARTEEELSKQRRRHNLEEQREEKEAEFATRQAVIAEKEKGTEREIEQMKLDHDKRLYEIEREKQQMIEKNIEYAAAQYDKTRKKGEKGFYARMEAGELTEAEKKAIGLNADQEAIYRSKLKIENEEEDKRQEERADKLIDAHQSYTDRKLAIDKKYQEDVAAIDDAISEAEARGDTERLEALRRSRVEAETKHAEQQAALSLEKLRKNPEYVRAFEDLGNTSTVTLNHLIQMFEEAKKAAGQSLDPEKLREYTSTLQQLYDEVNSRDPFSALTKAMRETKDALRELTNAQEEYNRVSNNEKVMKFTLNPMGGGILPYYLSLEEAQKNLNSAQDKYMRKLNDENKALNGVLNSVNELAGALSNLGSQIGGSFGDILSGIGNVANSATSTISKGMEAQKKAADFKAMEARGESVSALSKASNNASVYMAALSTALTVTDFVTKLLPSTEKYYEEAKAKQKEINSLREAVEDYELAVLRAQQAENNWFAHSGVQALRDAYEENGKIVEKYKNKVNEVQAVYEEAGSGIKKALPYIVATVATVAAVASYGGTSALAAAAWGAAIGAAAGATTAGNIATVDYLLRDGKHKKAKDNLRIQTRHKTFFRSEKTEDLQTWLNKQEGFENAQLFTYDEQLKDYLIDKELAQTIIDKWGGKLVGETKETLEELIKLREEYDEYVKAVKDYVSEMYSPLVDNFADAMFDWLETGEDALDKFREYAADTFKNIAKDLIKSMVIGTLFKPLEDQLVAIQRQFIEQSDGGMTMEEYMDAVMKSFDEFMVGAEQSIPAYQDLLTYIDRRLQDSGIDISGGGVNADQRATYNSLEKWTYEQADELINRATAMQIIQQHIYEALEGRSEYQIAMQNMFTNITGNMTLLVDGVTQTIELQQLANNKLDKIVANTNPIGEIRDIIKKIYKEQA